MTSRPDTPRSRRAADRLAEELAEILTTRTEDPRLKALTVTGARLSRDLSSARIWVSGPVAAGDERAVLQALEHAAPYFRTLLAPRLGLRIVPSLHFVIDRSIEAGSRIEELLRDLNRPKGE